jgi:hypothetical protein
MYGRSYRPTQSMELGIELVELNNTVQSQELLIEEYRLKAAKYKAYFFGKHNLAEKLKKQIEENYDNVIGEFDGFCYASWRNRAVYKTLEDMLAFGLITESDYEFCRFL